MKTSKCFLSTLIAAAAMTATAYADYTWTGGTTITDEAWKTETNWSLDGATWNIGPGVTNSNMWNKIIVSGTAEAPVSGTISNLEGWELKLDLINVSLTVAELVKLQSNCTVSLDSASSFSATLSTGKVEGNVTFENKGTINLAYENNGNSGGFVANLYETGIVNLTSVGNASRTAQVKGLSAVLGTTGKTATKSGLELSNYRNLITLGTGMSFDNTATTFTFTDASNNNLVVRDFSDLLGDGIQKNDNGTYGFNVEEGWVLVKDSSGYSVGYTNAQSVLALIWSGTDGATWNTTDANWKESAEGEAKVFADGGNVVFDKTANVVVADTGVSVTNVGVFGGEVTLSGGKVTVQDSIFVEDDATLKLGAQGKISGMIVVKSGGTFDLNGKSDGFSADGGSVTLAGGLLTNTGDDVGIGSRQLHTLVLTADSSIGGAKEFGIVGSGHGATTANLGGYTLTKIGTGTVLFANNTLQNGVLEVKEGAISDGGKNLTIANNATLKVSGGTLNISGAFTNNGTLEFAADSTYSGTNLFGGTLKVSGGITKVAGSASVKVVNISGGRLDVGDGGVLTVNDGTSLSGGDAVSGTINVLAGGTAKFAGHDLMGWSKSDNVIAILKGDEDKTANLMLNDKNGETVASMTFTSVVKMQGNALVSTDLEGGKFNTFGGKFIATGKNNKISKVQVELRDDFNVEVTGINDELEISGAIVNASERSGGLTKNGAGSLILSGNNTFTRALNVSEGTLVAASANALGGSRVTVASGAKLGLIASVMLTGASGIELNSGAKLLIDLSQMTIPVADDSQTTSLELVSGVALSQGNVELATGALSIDLYELSGMQSGWTASLLYNADTNNLSLSLAIPEPSLFGLIAGLGALTLVGTRRRRKRA